MNDKIFRWIGPLLLAMFLAGCEDKQVSQALDSDANGFLCPNCATKFYTSREIFPGHCPKCKQPNIQQVLGFVCPVDQHVTIAARGRGSCPCEKCGKFTSAISIPREKDLVAWGAPKMTAEEVGGQ